MIIEIDDSIRGAALRKLVRDKQILYFLEKYKSLEQAARHMGYNCRTLRIHIKKDKTLLKLAQVYSPTIGKDSINETVYAAIRYRLKKMDKDTRSEKLSQIRDILKKV